ncbi:EF-hand domain-containing protein [Yinghuangia aomiensis]
MSRWGGGSPPRSAIRTGEAGNAPSSTRTWGSGGTCTCPRTRTATDVSRGRSSSLRRWRCPRTRSWRGAALGGLAETYFAIADRDADGSIDAAEFADFTRGHCPTLSDASLAEAFGRLDTDGDGRLPRRTPRGTRRLLGGQRPGRARELDLRRPAAHGLSLAPAPSTRRGRPPTPLLPPGISKPVA